MYDEETSLLSPLSKGKKKKKKSALLENNFCVLLLLAVVVGAGVFFQIEVNDLTHQLAEEKNKVNEIQKVLEFHEEVIERFNSSVTNSDVISRLSGLETDLKTTKKSLQDDLLSVKADISSQLDQTLQQLRDTVDQAEQEISSEVEKVKKDVDQYVMTTQDQFSMENSFMVYQLAGTFTLLSCLISMWHMTAHLRKMNQPDVQRKILAILWMSPIYAITSWFSLVFHSAEGYLAIIKDGYEAYIIYQFLSFCIAVLGKGDRNQVVDLLSRRADHLTPPFRICGIFELCGCCRPPPFESNRALADAILLQCQFFAMQFVFFRPLTTTAMVVLGKMNYYGAGDGPTDYRSPQFYLTIVQNISIFTAFTGLLKFYHAVDKDLQWCRPFAKFLCIKGVVFMTFWQGLAISVLAETTDVGGSDAEEWAKSAQNFLICLEMLLFSIAHFYCFPTEEWEEGYRVKHAQGKFGDSIALGDFLQDMKLILRVNEKRKKLKHPVIAEEESEDDALQSQDGDTEALSIATAEVTQPDKAKETKKTVAQLLEEQLGMVSSDPDIEEAKRRLLESNVLRPEFFDESGSSCEESADDGESSDDDEGEFDDHAGVYPDEGSLAEESSDDSAVQEPKKGESASGTVADRTASVVVQSDTTPEDSALSTQTAHASAALRPSIFTTVASFVDADRERDPASSNGT